MTKLILHFLAFLYFAHIDTHAFMICTAFAGAKVRHKFDIREVLVTSCYVILRKVFEGL